MKQQTEKHQQINDLAVDTSSVRDDPGVNGARTGAKSDADLTRPCSLKVLARALARKRAIHPAPGLVTTLIGQCRNYGAYPDMGPKILETIDAIERAV